MRIRSETQWSTLNVTARQGGGNLELQVQATELYVNPGWVECPHSFRPAERGKFTAEFPLIPNGLIQDAVDVIE